MDRITCDIIRDLLPLYIDEVCSAGKMCIRDSVKVERAKVRTKIKEATNANSLYHRAAKPWLDAKKLLIQEENYKHYDEIAAMYEEAKARADAQRAKEDADDAARVAQKKADKELARANRRHK